MLEVLLTTEGTYPYNRGGVATWCETLVNRVEGVRYHILAVVANPFVPRRFRVPANVMSVTAIPLWGTEEPTEHLNQLFALTYERKLKTTPAVIQSQFLPLFDPFLQQLWAPEPDGEVVAKQAWGMYRFFQQYDYLAGFKSQAVWEHFRQHATSRPLHGRKLDPSLRDLLQSLGWVYRFLTVLTTPVPRVDLVHASAAAFCALPAIVSKLEHGTPMLLTEHGVYLREQYLSIGKSELSPFSKAFLLSLVSSVSRAGLWAADQVSPVAAYNVRWESQLGVPEHRFQVIYNGVDPAVFEAKPRPAGAPLTVVSVARIDPIKDLETLLRAAVLVRSSMPEVRFVVYGGVSVESYYERLLQLRKELGLEEAFTFAGHVSTPALAYQSGDVVALSSISEGFPYAVVEAMMSERAVVATDVGGTAEALAECGRLVAPQDPEAMAAALLEVLGNSELRAELAEEGRNRALAYFTVRRQAELYQQSYVRLARRMQRGAARQRQLLLWLQRAEALRMVGELGGAERQLAEALAADSAGPEAAVLLLQMARIALDRGDTDGAWLYMERAEALQSLTPEFAA